MDKASQTETSPGIDTEFPTQAIAIVKSPFTEKFSVPRQPSLTPSVISTIKMLAPFNNSDAFIGIEEFSHIWVMFRFHQNLEQGWKPQVRPPRLGGNKKLGVFATRSSFRPNGFGLSAVKLLDITSAQNDVQLLVSGLDVVNGTPVYDIKPYIAYTDAIPEANSGFAAAPPKTIAVEFTEDANNKLNLLATAPELTRKQVVESLAQDPRPAYRKSKPLDKNEYGVAFAGLNFKWRIKDNKICVFAVSNTMN